MTATTIQTSVMTVRQPAISGVVVGAFVAAALALAMFIAMVPGLARVPVGADQPRAVAAPVTRLVESAPAHESLSTIGLAESEAGPHPSH
jgi:hypothetical protein